MKLSLVLLASTAIFGVYDASAQEPGYVAPKTVWGAPDFTGVWNNASLTTVQRLAGASSVTVNEEEAQKLAKNNVTNLVAQDEALRVGLEQVVEFGDGRDHDFGTSRRLNMRSMRSVIM